MERHNVTGTSGAASTNLIQGSICLGNPTTPEQVWSPWATYSDSQCKSFGRKLWLAGAPTHPSVDFFTSLRELRSEGLPSLPGLKSSAAAIAAFSERTLGWKKATERALHAPAEEHLNWSFGWAPMLSDMKSFARTAKMHNKILRNYRAQANKTVHRRLELPADTASQTIPSSFVVFPTSANVFATGGGLTNLMIRRVWFEGSYRFRMPIGNSSFDKLSRYEMYANKLFGVRPDPQTVWNLTPWSWAVDWFVDVGGMLDAVTTTTQDGLTAKDAYLMTSNSRELRSYGKVASKGISAQLFRTDLYESKKRIAASPFGFDTSLSQLTERQWAIAASIGVSRWK